MSTINRTIEDVSCLIHHAKLLESDLLPVTQSIEFSPDFGESSKDVTLMEVNSELLKIIKEGNKVTIRGDNEDSVVLCTSDKTFEVREAETSNSLVLVPNLRDFEELSKEGERSLSFSQVHGIHYTYLEVKECRPKLQKLKKMLDELPYDGQESEEPMNDMEDDQGYTQNKKKYTWDDLMEHVQCSEEQLEVALADYEAYNIYGFWQILDFDYKLKIFSNILSVIEENSWSVDRVPRDTVLNTVDASEPRTVYSQCIEYFFKPTQNTDASGQTLYCYNDDKIACLFGEALLRQVNKYNLKDFLNMWQQSVPSGITTSINQLDGVALIDYSSSPEVIWHFPASNMPEDIIQRFKLLFETKERWTINQITPYIKDLASAKTTVNAILTKHCRSFTQEGTKYYTARLNK